MFYLFSYLFNNAVSSSGHPYCHITALVNNKLESTGKSMPWPNLRYHPGIARRG